MAKIIFVPDRHWYHIKYYDDKNIPRYLGRFREDSLQTAMWFYTLEGIEMEIAKDSIDEEVEQIMQEEWEWLNTVKDGTPKK